MSQYMLSWEYDEDMCIWWLEREELHEITTYEFSPDFQDMDVCTFDNVDENIDTFHFRLEIDYEEGELFEQGYRIRRRVEHE